MKTKLSPSMLSIDFGKVAEQLKLVEDAGTQYIHLDVMDGIFVPNISFGIPVIKSIRKHSNMVFDAHLMIVEPEKYVEEFRKAGADIINFHVEATKYPAEVIQQIKATGAKAGITINPRTPVEVVYPLPEGCGYGFGYDSRARLWRTEIHGTACFQNRQLAEWKKELGLEFDIEVDGGVTLDNVREVLDAGANVIVAGSAVFGKEDIAGAAKGFLDIFKEYE